MIKVYIQIFNIIIYYYVTKIIDYNIFRQKFISSNENEDKYALISILIHRDEDLVKDAEKIKNLNPINNLSNILLNIYSFKIGRDEANTKIFKNEVHYIEEILGENESLENKLINPFIQAWNNIKEKCTQYKCRKLVLKEPLTPGSFLSHFLVDDGDTKGGIFLASAYENFICWQNRIIDLIIAKNKLGGILNSYVPQLEQEIDVQDAKEDDIISIGQDWYDYLNDLIHSCSMRNIIEKGNKINYNNYNDIEYDFEFIEDELAKKFLLGKKKFRNRIKFVTYLYEGFRGVNSTILINYNMKYPSRELKNEEKKFLNEFINENKNKGIYNDIFSSLQILMNEIIKENYNSSTLIYNIIDNLPKFVVINQKLVQLLKDKYQFDIEQKLNYFSIDCLVPFFEYFESLCWEEISQNILKDYKCSDLSDESKNNILNYFEKNKDSLINKKNLTNALRKLLSRSIVGNRQEVDINNDAILSNYIDQESLWDHETFSNPNFESEIFTLFKDDIKIKHAFHIFNILNGDNILKKEIEKDKNQVKEVFATDPSKAKEINDNQEDKNGKKENIQNPEESSEYDEKEGS